MKDTEKREPLIDNWWRDGNPVVDRFLEDDETMVAVLGCLILYHQRARGGRAKGNYEED